MWIDVRFGFVARVADVRAWRPVFPAYARSRLPQVNAQTDGQFMSKSAYLWLGRAYVTLCNRIITKTNGMNLSANTVVRVSRLERYVANAQPLFKVMGLLLTAFWLSGFTAAAEIWTPPKSADVLCECSSHGDLWHWRLGCLNVLDFRLSKSFWNRSRPSEIPFRLFWLA